MYDECVSILEKAIKLKPSQKAYKNLKKSATEEKGFYLKLSNNFFNNINFILKYFYDVEKNENEPKQKSKRLRKA